MVTPLRTPLLVDTVPEMKYVGFVVDVATKLLDAESAPLRVTSMGEVKVYPASDGVTV